MDELKLNTRAEGTVLVVEDDPALQVAVCETLQLAGYRTVAADNGAIALKIISSEQIDLIISDVQMPEVDGYSLLSKVRQYRPDIPFVMVTAYGSIEKAVEAIQCGAVDYLVKPFECQVLLEAANRFINRDKPATESEPVAVDDISCNAVRLARRVAKSDATVMITGESGTGKEVYARLIHEESTRKNQPFVAINCAAIPETMLESILFGYEKGAFTGAYRSREGKFEQAEGGTILLDEISEMDIGLQAKLLRVLQEKEVERLGGNKSIPLDVRVLATTNRNLKAQVDAGKFREDLYYRLNVFPLKLPALRHRTADVLPLAKHFITQFGDGVVTLSHCAEQALGEHNWPGNVRELENVIHRALILRGGASITANDITFELEAVDTFADESHANSCHADATLEDDLKVQEQHLILDALRAEAGNRQNAAERLGISPRTLRYKLAKFRKAGNCLPELASA